MLRVVAGARHFFLHGLHDEPLGMGTLIDTILRGGIFFGPNTPIVLRSMNGEELLSSRKRVKSRKKRSILDKKAQNLSYQ